MRWQQRICIIERLSIEALISQRLFFFVAVLREVVMGSESCDHLLQTHEIGSLSSCALDMAALVKALCEDHDDISQLILFSFLFIGLTFVGGMPSNLGLH